MCSETNRDKLIFGLFGSDTGLNMVLEADFGEKYGLCGFAVECRKIVL